VTVAVITCLFGSGVLGIVWNAGRRVALIEQRLENIEDNSLTHMEKSIDEVKRDVRDLRKIFLERSTSAKKS